jgi:dethiobiotin synthetase/adenosylmethionine--8-amino-7-oxononanoate aminotransferase
VLALTNSYHGDTLGAMDCAAASPFNGPLQTPWYSGRGLFLDPPHLALVRGTWTLRPPAWLQQQQAEQQPDSGSSGWTWDSQAAALDVVCRLRWDSVSLCFS